MQFVCVFFLIGRKFEFLNFQGSVAETDHCSWNSSQKLIITGALT